MNSKKWCVYILECRDKSYYTGITNNLSKRMEAHKAGKGSKYVLSKGFGQLLCSKNYANKSEALKAEYQLKQLSRREKLNFFNSSS